jgi:hypothetical protein
MTIISEARASMLILRLRRAIHRRQAAGASLAEDRVEVQKLLSTSVSC